MIEFKDKIDGQERFSARKAEPAVPGRQEASYHLLTENAEAYQQLRQNIFDHFHPQTLFARQVADSFVELLWREDRYRVFSSDLLDLRIARDYDRNEADYPNADPRIYTALAFSSIVAEKPYLIAETRLLQFTKAVQNYVKMLEKLCKKA